MSQQMMGILIPLTAIFMGLLIPIVFAILEYRRRRDIVEALRVPLLAAAPAQAASRVSVANPDGDAVVDATYANTLTVSGSGFQSVQGGHGGVYVFFGTVDSGWQPSRGGRTGAE